MARLPRRREELPLKQLLCAVALLFLLARAGDLQAQAPGPDSASPAVVRGFLELSPRLTRIRDATSPALGLAALLGLPGRWRAGGAALVLLERVPLDAASGLPETTLHVGYGGVVVERSSRPWTSTPAAGAGAGLIWVARLMAGAAHADVRSAATGSRLRSDNFLVVEPRLAIETRLLKRMTVGLTAGYRVPIGVDRLGELDERDLRGGSLGLLLRVGPF